MCAYSVIIKPFRGKVTKMLLEGWIYWDDWLLETALHVFNTLPHKSVFLSGWAIPEWKDEPVLHQPVCHCQLSESEKTMRLDIHIKKLMLIVKFSKLHDIHYQVDRVCTTLRRDKWRGATPMQAKLIKLDLVPLPSMTREYKREVFSLGSFKIILTPWQIRLVLGRMKAFIFAIKWLCNIGLHHNSWIFIYL